MKANEDEETSSMASADLEIPHFVAETLIRQSPAVSAAATTGGAEQLRFHQHQQPPSIPSLHHHQFVSQRYQFQQQQQQHLMMINQQQRPQPYNLQFHQQYSPHFGMRFGAGAAAGVVVSPQIQQQLLMQQQLYQARLQSVQNQRPQQQQFVAARQTPPPVAKNVAAAKTVKESAPTVNKRKGGTGGLSKICGLSPELQAVVGQSELARTEVVRQLWVYIRKHNLQDPSNKRKIICDEALRLVFETDCTDMFKMNKLLSKHIFPLQAPKESAPAKRSKVNVQEDSLGTESVYTALISDELATFLGTATREIDAVEATNSVWDYIKANCLEDSDAMVINCDEKLRELFQCESVPISALNKILSRHLVQSS